MSDRVTPTPPSAIASPGWSPGNTGFIAAFSIAEISRAGPIASVSATTGMLRDSCRASRIRAEFMTQRPSSLNIRTPAAAISAMGDSRSPASPIVIEPTGNTSAFPAARPNAAMWAARATESVTGSVLAIAKTAVKPPRAAQAVPLATVSDASKPGSRRWVCMSTKPGSASSPSASITSAPGAISATR